MSWKRKSKPLEMQRKRIHIILYHLTHSTYSTLECWYGYDYDFWGITSFVKLICCIIYEYEWISRHLSICCVEVVVWVLIMSCLNLEIEPTAYFHVFCMYFWSHIEIIWFKNELQKNFINTHIFSYNQLHFSPCILSNGFLNRNIMLPVIFSCMSYSCKYINYYIKSFSNA